MKELSVYVSLFFLFSIQEASSGGEPSFPCSKFLQGSETDRLEGHYLDLLKELKNITSMDWHLILRNILSSDTPFNPIVSHAVETIGYFGQFESLLEEELNWKIVQARVRNLWGEMTLERRQVERSQKRARFFEYPTLQQGFDYRLIRSPQSKGHLDREKLVTLTTSSSSFIIYFDREARLISVDLLTGVERVIRDGYSHTDSFLTSFMYRNRHFVILGVTYKDGERGVDVVDVVTGEKVQSWVGLRICQGFIQIGDDSDGKPRFVSGLWENLGGGIWYPGRQVAEFTFGNEEVKVFSRSVGGSLGKVIQYFTSEHSEEFLLLKMDFENEYRVVRYPSLKSVGGITYAQNADRVNHVFKKIAPSGYIDSEGRVRLSLGPIRRSLEMNSGKEFEAGFLIEEGKTLKLPVSHILSSRLSQTPIVVENGVRLGILRESMSESAERLLVVDLERQRILNSFEVDGEVRGDFRLRFVRIKGELFIFLVTKDVSGETSLHLVQALRQEEQEIERYQLNFDLDSTWKGSDFSIVQTRRGFIAVQLQSKDQVRSVFLSHRETDETD